MFGAHPMWKVYGYDLPRIGIGYREVRPASSRAGAW